MPPLQRPADADADAPFILVSSSSFLIICPHMRGTPASHLIQFQSCSNELLGAIVDQQLPE
jgi:hypothetical protein